MTSGELRKKFLEFFEKNGHKIAPSSSLLPTDPSVLFTTAGMQQFKDYYSPRGKSPYGKNVATCQKCFRTSDIDEVGDERHLTFFEMLGNFSFGGYGKEKAIKLAKEFLDSINIKIDYVTVFAGDKDTPPDNDSAGIWEKLGFSKEKDTLKFCGKEDNFWGPTGEKGPCGPTTEIYVRGIEVWNIVFNQYYQQRGGVLEPLKIQGIDTGMGLERLAMVSQEKKNIFETDLFEPLILGISKFRNIEFRDRGGTGEGQSLKAVRIVADHIKAAGFLISEGILPSNMGRGYVLRRILRRAIRYGKVLELPPNFLIPLAQKAIEIYQEIYPEIKSEENNILAAIQQEEEKFGKTLEQGIKEFEKGRDAFTLYATYGFPIELTQELAKEKGGEIDIESFKKEFEKHQEISRAGAEKKFGGHGLQADATGEMVKLHTATHLLHAALREALGNHVQQMGSDITSERTRFDFFHPQKMTPQEIKKVEDLVNQKIKEDLEVKKEETAYEEAIKSGALAFFREKYPQKVSVYSIEGFSKEICAGPHVNRTSAIGKIKIIKEESSSAGIRRIRAILEK